MHYFGILLLLVILTTGCKKGALSPEEYMNWLNNPENGLVVTQQSNSFKYSLRYRPYTELGLIEIHEYPTKARLDSIVPHLGGLEYYLLKIEGAERQPDVLKTNLSGEADYYDRLNYLTFNFQSDIAIVVNQDTSMCTLYHMERDYGVSPYLKILLAFPIEDTGFVYDRQILIYPRIESSPEIMKFSVKKDDILNIPQLKIQD